MSQRINFLPPEPISLVDNEHHREESPVQAHFRQTLQFKQIIVGDCTIVNSNQTNKFSVWQVELVLAPTDRSGGSSPRIQLYKRYSDFENLRNRLIQALPSELHQSIPSLPPKVRWYESWRYQDVNFDKKWLAKRRAGLEYFLNQVLLNERVVNSARTCIRNFLES